MKSAGVKISAETSALVQEFDSLALPDKRLNARAREICTKWSRLPSASLPQAMNTEAGLEGAYRFLKNPRVQGDELAEPHLAASWGRAAAGGRVLSLEDTTEMRFGGNSKREGLGELMNKGQGFYLHLALLVTEAAGVYLPAGVGAYELLVRDPERVQLPRKQRYKDPGRESLRWQRVSAEVDARALLAGVEVVHVCDREADDYAWLDDILQRGGRFVIRGSYDRRIGVRTNEQSTQCYLKDLVGPKMPLYATREVGFQARITSGGRQRRAPRSARQATLELRATEITLVRPDQTTAQAKSLSLNLVVVSELNAPEGEAPIQWVLLTTEEISTAEDVLRVVDAYRARWTIEEFFKALKTGCSYEQLQLESLHALHNALGFCLPMAWQMLVLRSLARDLPDLPAQGLLSSEQQEALEIIASKADNRYGLKLKKPLTAQGALLAVARLGGHLKQNGAPGWLIISRGFQVLDQFVTTMQVLTDSKPPSVER